MPPPPLRIAILGCGSAGPAAALFLARAGHSVEIFERAPALGPVGTGFILQPTGIQVLDELGLRSEAESLGTRLTHLHAETSKGRPLLDLHYARISPGTFGLGMQRASMLDLFVRRLHKDGVPLHLGQEILGCRRSGSQRFLSTNAREWGPYDLVVVASGARSSSRHWVNTRIREREYAWGAFWTIVPDPERIFSDGLHQVVDGAHTMLGLLPTGARIDDPTRTPLVSVFWSLRRDQLEATRAAGADAMLAKILRLEPRAESILGSAGTTALDFDDWSFAEYLDIVMSRWHDPGLVVLGDAAHAMSPQLGQGVNLALWDARTLAQTLTESDSLPEALTRYSERRRRHLRFYQFATRWLTPFFQSDSRLAASLRDCALPLLSRSAFFDRQMTRTMIGVKTGPLSEIATPQFLA